MIVVKMPLWHKLKLSVCLMLFISVEALAEDNTTNDQEMSKTAQILENMGITAVTEYGPHTVWSNVSKNPPKVGVIAKDQQGRLLDIFDLDGQEFEDKKLIHVRGYQLPPGGTFERVGAAGWIKAVGDLRSSYYRSTEVGLTIKDAVTEVDRVSSTIRDLLCLNPGRPTEVVMTFDAGFNIVVAAGAGTQLTWDMEIVCKRE